MQFIDEAKQSRLTHRYTRKCCNNFILRRQAIERLKAWLHGCFFSRRNWAIVGDGDAGNWRRQRAIATIAGVTSALVRPMKKDARRWAILGDLFNIKSPIIGDGGDCFLLD